MATYQISATYYAGTSALVEFPDGKTWSDVSDWYIKWDTLFIQWAPNTEYGEFSLNSDTLDCIDWERPTDVTVYPVDDEGVVDYSEEVATA